MRLLDYFLAALVVITMVTSLQAVGALLATRAKAKGIDAVAFDRSGRRYHGRVKALAEAARAGGLQF